MFVEFSQIGCCKTRYPGAREYWYQTGSSLASLFFVLLWSPLVSAQKDKSICPEVGASATAAEQAICWFKRDLGGSSDCISEEGETNLCITQAGIWCAKASFDDDVVSTTCLLTALRAGRLGEAKEIATYLGSPSQSVANCVEALKRANIRILTNPKGAQIVIDGRTYGHAPVEVRLLGDWWESHIKARFNSDPDVVEVEVPSSKLLDAFDTKECIFGDLIIEGPQPPRSEVQQLSKTDGQPNRQNQCRCPPSQPAGNLESDQPDWLYWTGIIAMAGASVASGVTATLLFLDGQADYKTLQDKCLGPEPRETPGCYQGNIDADTSSIRTRYTVGRILAVSAGVFLAGATLLYLLKPDDAQEKSGYHLSIGPTSVEVAKRF